MKLRSLLLCTAFGAGLVSNAQVGISANNAVPATSAMLDLDVTSLATKKGLLIPRMTAALRAGIATPATGLIVFQTDNTASSPKGLWYFDGTAWTPLYSGSGAWTVAGNTGTNPAVDYLGTNDAQVFTVRTNAVERMRVQPTTGRVGINTAAVPAEQVDLNGALKLVGTSSANNQGAMQWNAATSAHDGNITGTALGWYQLENAFGERLNQNYQVTPPVTCTPGTVVTMGTGGTSLGATIETPYSTFWEDGRHQYLWLASDLATAGICPNMNITAAAFNATGSWSIPQVNVEIKMKNTTTTTMASGFDYTGLTLVYTAASVSPTPGWNNNTFSSPFQWNGSSNVILEYCHNNYNWAGNVSVQADATVGFAGGYGLYCDACGGSGAFPCVPTIPPNPGCGVGPCGPGCAMICSGYSMTPGCMLTSTSSLTTCDGTFQFTGAQGSFNKRPRMQWTCAYTTANPLPVIVQGNYMYSTLATMVGDAGWATAPVFPNQAFKGPGTLSAKISVWGGTTLLSDFVFDRYYDGQPKSDELTRSVAYPHVSVQELGSYVERERHLPTVDGREQWNQNGMFSVDQLHTQLWVTVEEQALYIKELNERMAALQQYLVQKRLNELKEGGR